MICHHRSTRRKPKASVAQGLTAVIGFAIGLSLIAWGGRSAPLRAELDVSPAADRAVDSSPVLDGRADTRALTDLYQQSKPLDALFPLGFMGASTGFPQIAAGGFNVVHQFRGVQEIDAAEGYLDQAESAGLLVIQNMPRCRAYPGCEGRDVEVWGEGEWARFISTLAAHENLIAWYLPDEIDDFAAAANLYEWVQRYDPDSRPVSGNPGTYKQSTINLFPTFTDFVWTAAYPEYDREPRALVTYAMKRGARACRGTDARWGAILQFFDSADFGRDGGYPTAHEIRSDSYQAIIGGATGLLYFAYGEGQDLSELLSGIETVADEIVGAGGLDEVIVSPPVSQTVTATVVSGPVQSPAVYGEVYDSIQILQKERQGIYIFAANIATETLQVELYNLPKGITAAQVLFENRTVPVQDGVLGDTFSEAQVHIYFAVAHRAFLPLILKRL